MNFSMILTITIAIASDRIHVAVVLCLTFRKNLYGTKMQINLTNYFFYTIIICLPVENQFQNKKTKSVSCVEWFAILYNKMTILERMNKVAFFRRKFTKILYEKQW